MAIDRARVAPLHATAETGSDSVTIDLGQRRFFVAWITINMVDPRLPFDRNEAIATDIFTVDGSRTASRVFDGDHFGPLGSGSNVFQGAFVGVGQRIEYWLRVFGTVDAAAEAVVVV
jgi:hypothetical protein